MRDLRGGLGGVRGGLGGARGQEFIFLICFSMAQEDCSCYIP